MDERALTEKLIAYDTSAAEGIRLAAGFVKGWLEARDIEARQIDVRGLPVTIAEVGPADAPTVLLHGHLDVVPGRPGQFEPRVEGDRLVGRGAYDMKGALAAMLLALHDLRDAAEVRVRLGVVPDEESEEEAERGSDQLVREGFVGAFKSRTPGPVGPRRLEPGERRSPMPWRAYSGMTEEDLGAIYDYLRTVPPVENRVNACPDAR